MKLLPDVVELFAGKVMIEIQESLMELKAPLRRSARLSLRYQVVDQLKPRECSVGDRPGNEKGRVGLDDCSIRSASLGMIPKRQRSTSKICIEHDSALRRMMF